MFDRNPTPTNPLCHCCLDERIEAGKAPRTRAPIRIIGKKLPVLFCIYCDGDAITNARLSQVQ